MNRVGLICDFKFERHPQFKSYFYAITKLLGEPKIVNSKFDLLEVDLLIVGDDHYTVHKDILHSKGFIEVCNILEIPIIVLTTKKIFDSYFPWNVLNYEKISTIKYLHHFTADVDDCEKLNTNVHRISISSNFKDVYKTSDKKEGMIFIGSTKCKFGSYDKRRELLNTLGKDNKLIVVDKTIPKWEDYMNELSKYRFVLSPLGNGNFLPTRFYETLAVGSIPVQQVKPNTLKYYDIEAGFEDCIFFEHPEEVRDKIKNFEYRVSHNELWTEDNFNIIFKKCEKVIKI